MFANERLRKNICERTSVRKIMTERNDSRFIDTANAVGGAMAFAFFGYGYWFRTGVPAGWST